MSVCGGQILRQIVLVGVVFENIWAVPHVLRGILSGSGVRCTWAEHSGYARWTGFLYDFSIAAGAFGESQVA
jgi:hypothetical protein